MPGTAVGEGGFHRISWNISNCLGKVDSCCIDMFGLFEPNNPTDRLNIPISFSENLNLLKNLLKKYF